MILAEHQDLILNLLLETHLLHLIHYLIKEMGKFYIIYLVDI